MSSRGLSTAVLSLLDAFSLPRMIVLFEFETLGLRITNFPRSLTFENDVYTGGKAAADEFTVKALGMSENLNFEAPSAVIEIGSVNGWAQALFFADSFREDTCIVTLLYSTGSGFLSTGWRTRFKCDAEECNAANVRIRLGSLDAATGTEVPRRTTQSEGCQWRFQQSDPIAGCTFRFDPSVHVAALATCDRTYDGANGCGKHFPDITDPRTGDERPRVKPYGAFLGSLDHRLVKGRR